MIVQPHPHRASVCNKYLQTTIDENCYTKQMRRGGFSNGGGGVVAFSRVKLTNSVRKNYEFEYELMLGTGSSQ